MKDTFIIVGLGNVGENYQRTRHNIGFVILDLLAQRLNMNSFKLKHKACVSEQIVNNQKLILAKPQTYMNLSGDSVKELIGYYKIDLKNLIIIYDDIDLPFGSFKIKPSGGAGTHNGMRSIVNSLMSTSFSRIRIGIGMPINKHDLSNFVLSNFTSGELEILKTLNDKIVDALIDILSQGINFSMNKYN